MSYIVRKEVQYTRNHKFGLLVVFHWEIHTYTLLMETELRYGRNGIRLRLALNKIKLNLKGSFRMKNAYCGKAKYLGDAREGTCLNATLRGIKIRYSRLRSGNVVTYTQLVYLSTCRCYEGILNNTMKRRMKSCLTPF